MILRIWRLNLGGAHVDLVMQTAFRIARVDTCVASLVIIITTIVATMIEQLIPGH